SGNLQPHSTPQIAENWRNHAETGFRNPEPEPLPLHPRGRVERGEFCRVELVLHDEGSFLDPPEPLPGAEAWEEFLFGAGEAEGCGGGSELVGFLPVDDPRLRIRQE